MYVFGKNVNREQVIIMLSLEGIFYEIEENEIWSFNYNIMEGVISLSLVNPYTARRHEMKIEKIYKLLLIDEEKLKLMFSLCIVQIKKKKKVQSIILLWRCHILEQTKSNFQ